MNKKAILTAAVLAGFVAGTTTVGSSAQASADASFAKAGCGEGGSCGESSCKGEAECKGHKGKKGKKGSEEGDEGGEE